MPQSSDLLLCGLCPSMRFNVVHADVTDTARLLEQNHLCGPTAGVIQAEALAAVALLQSELAETDEAISLRMELDGPLKELMVEARKNGNLRGFTGAKILNYLDDREDVELAEAMGQVAKVQIMRSVPGRLTGKGLFTIQPATVNNAIETYFRRSLQRQVATEINAQTSDHYVEMSRAILIECLPDGNRQEFGRLRELFDDETVLEALEFGNSPAEVCNSIGLPPVIWQPAIPLRFGCTCSQKQIEVLFESFPTDDIEQMLEAGKPASIHCHMCGASYEIGLEYLKSILAKHKQQN